MKSNAPCGSWRRRAAVSANPSHNGRIGGGHHVLSAAGRRRVRRRAAAGPRGSDAGQRLNVRWPCRFLHPWRAVRLEPRSGPNGGSPTRGSHPRPQGHPRRLFPSTGRLENASLFSLVFFFSQPNSETVADSLAAICIRTSSVHVITDNNNNNNKEAISFSWATPPATEGGNDGRIVCVSDRVCVCVDRKTRLICWLYGATPWSGFRINLESHEIFIRDRGAFQAADAYLLLLLLLLLFLPSFLGFLAFFTQLPRPP